MAEKDKAAEPEVEVLPPREPETEAAFVPDKLWSPEHMAALVRLDPAKTVQMIEKMVELLRMLKPALIKATYAGDWVGHKAAGGKMVYHLEEKGCQRIAPLLGLVVIEPQVQRINNPDGSYTYVYRAGAYSRTLGVQLPLITGARTSSDEFFANQKGVLDEWDVAKAAETNWYSRAVPRLAGLQGMTIEDLKAGGLDGAKVSNIEYKGKKQKEAAQAPPPNGEADTRTISGPQANRFWAIAYAAGRAVGMASEDVQAWVHDWLPSQFQVAGVSDIPRSMYDEAVDKLVELGGEDFAAEQRAKFAERE